MMRYDAYSRTADWSKKVYFESGNGQVRTPEAFSEVYKQRDRESSSSSSGDADGFPLDMGMATTP
jgi:hypothetical protein